MIKNIIYFLSLFLVLTFSQSIQAQVSVSTKIDTNIMLIGDQTRVTFEAIMPGNYLVDMPVFTDTIIEKLEILDIFDQDTTVEDNLLKIHQQFQVTNFDSGWYTIPPVKFMVKDTITNQIDSFYSAPVYFGVMTMPLDTANADAITDIKAPIEAPITFREVLPFLAIGLGVLLVLLLSYFLYMRFARKEPMFARKEKPKEPAHVIAFRDLDQLKDQKLWQQGRNKAFYSQLTDIVRTYMENRYGVYAMEMTSDEIMQILGEEKILKKELKDQLFDVLTLADFVKFAKATTMEHENEQSMKFAYEFVIKTKVEELLSEDKKDSGEDNVEQKAISNNE